MTDLGLVHVSVYLFLLRYILCCMNYIVWKVSVFWVFLARIFPYSDQKDTEHGHFLRSASKNALAFIIKNHCNQTMCYS